VIPVGVGISEFLWYVLPTNEEPSRHGYSALDCI
jgi:hypothetical protein